MDHAAGRAFCPPPRFQEVFLNGKQDLQAEPCRISGALGVLCRGVLAQAGCLRAALWACRVLYRAAAGGAGRMRPMRAVWRAVAVRTAVCARSRASAAWDADVQPVEYTFVRTLEPAGAGPRAVYAGSRARRAGNRGGAAGVFPAARRIRAYPVSRRRQSGCRAQTVPSPKTNPQPSLGGDASWIAGPASSFMDKSSFSPGFEKNGDKRPLRVYNMGETAPSRAGKVRKHGRQQADHNPDDCRRSAGIEIDGILLSERQNRENERGDP